MMMMMILRIRTMELSIIVAAIMISYYDFVVLPVVTSFGNHHHHHHYRCLQYHGAVVEMTKTTNHNNNIRFVSSSSSSSSSSPLSDYRLLLPFSSLLTKKSQTKPFILLQLSQSSFDHSTEDDECNDDDNNNESRKGIAVLLTVPLAWGTFEVAVRYVYTAAQTSTGTTIPSLVFSFAYYTIATLTLFIINQIYYSTTTSRPLWWKPNEMIDTIHNTPSSSNNICNDTAAIVSSMNGTSNTTYATQSPTFGVLSNESINVVVPTTTGTVSTSNQSIVRNGGIELGTYLFIGNLFQLFGLRTVSSDRAAFLLQLTTIFVPLVSTISVSSLSSSSSTARMNNNNNRRSPISIRMWIACIIALIGVGIMSFDIDTTAIASTMNDNNNNNILSQFHWSMGDTLIVLAAMAYTCHCIRLDVYAKQCSNAIELATYKAGTEMIWTMFTIGIVLYVTTTTTTISSGVYSGTDSDIVSFIVTTGNELQHYMMTSGGISQSDQYYFDFSTPSTISPVVLFAIVWTGLVPIAYTIVAQTYGQRRVPPVTANLIYTIQPLGTAFFAYIILNETLSMGGYIGGLIIGIAVLLIITVENNNNNADMRILESKHDE